MSLNHLVNSQVANVSNNKVTNAKLQKAFWFKTAPVMAYTLTSMPGVPSYFPAYKRWLTIRERARFGRLLAPQNLLLSRFEGEHQLTSVHSANAQMRRWETRLSSFLRRFTPKNFAVYKEFFNTKNTNCAQTSTNGYRQTSPRNLSLTHLLQNMFDRRYQNGSDVYQRTFRLDGSLRSSRRSPEMAVKLAYQNDQLRKERHHIVPRSVTTFSTGANGLLPTRGYHRRAHFPVINLHWIWSLLNGRVVSRKGRIYKRIGGQRLEWATLNLSDSLISIEEYREKVLKPVSEVEKKLGDIANSPGEIQRKVRNLYPFFAHRDLNLTNYEAVFAPAGRMWRDFRGIRYVSARKLRNSAERQTPAQINFYRKRDDSLMYSRSALPTPTMPYAVANARAGRLKPRSIFEYRVNKRWAGQRRYMMRMMGWKRVWQYRRYFRHWSAKNANGRRFEISRRYDQRLDNFVVTYLGARSIVYARELIKRGHVFVNGVQKYNATLPVRQTEIVSLSKIAYLWLAQPFEDDMGAQTAIRFSYYADVEDKRVIYGRHGHSVALASTWVHGGTGRFGGRLQFAGSLIEGLTMWRR